MPLPTTTTSACTVQPGSGADSRSGRRRSVTAATIEPISRQRESRVVDQPSTADVPRDEQPRLAGCRSGTKFRAAQHQVVDADVVRALQNGSTYGEHIGHSARG